MSRAEEPLYMPEGEAKLWQAMLVMAQELSVARDRIDLLERRLAVKAVLAPGEAEEAALDAEALAARAKARTTLVERILQPIREQPK